MQLELLLLKLATHPLKDPECFQELKDTKEFHKVVDPSCRSLLARPSPGGETVMGSPVRLRILRHNGLHIK
jgi:hypothetical protein